MQAPLPAALVKLVTSLLIFGWSLPAAPGVNQLHSQLSKTLGMRDGSATKPTQSSLGCILWGDTKEKDHFGDVQFITSVSVKPSEVNAMATALFKLHKTFSTISSV